MAPGLDRREQPGERSDERSGAGPPAQTDGRPPWLRGSGASTRTSSNPSARPVFAEESIPPSIQRRPPSWTGGEMPGTAPLADTASTSGYPSECLNARSWPDSRSMAVTHIAHGHSRVARRACTVRRRSSASIRGRRRRATAPRPIPMRSGLRKPRKYDQAQAATSALGTRTDVSSGAERCCASNAAVRSAPPLTVAAAAKAGLRGFGHHQAKRPVAACHCPQISVLGIPRSGRKVPAKSVDDSLFDVWVKERPH
jgi:hypothetical protein